MRKSKKPTAREELERIEDALVESILIASGDALREELTAAGLDPDSCIAEVDATIAVAKAERARERLKQARTEVADWRKREPKANVTALDAARAKFEQLRSGDQGLKQRLMLAARKGEGLSDSDMEGLLEDIAALDELEGKKEDE
ncbi:hypothetical protein [Parvibaculum sp.]|uniref:hypothetical protein n=1 Tax=Parvibaculum sp. TaxID=2024848 RepID=UPI0027359E45|nr:hypothetical protein [Parvibaculum sp.]MDP3328958.1 hypothetical protein [Parvibaculum sp.]